jgi:hypothetical protein
MDVGFTVGGIAGSANPGEIKMTGTMTFVIDRRP